MNHHCFEPIKSISISITFFIIANATTFRREAEKSCHPVAIEMQELPAEILEEIKEELIKHKDLEMPEKVSKMDEFFDDLVQRENISEEHKEIIRGYTEGKHEIKTKFPWVSVIILCLQLILKVI